MLPVLQKWWPALAGGLLIAALLTLTYCSGRTAGKSGEVVKQQRETIQVQQDLGKANEAAAGRRVNDTAVAAKQEKELKDALDASNDPDQQRILRGCIILQQQHRDIENIPACSRYTASR